MPPIDASGMLASTIAAFLTEPNALNSRMKMRNTLIGTINPSRVIARCWFSNSPPNVA